jgi:hypothetical protein
MAEGEFLKEISEIWIGGLGGALVCGLWQTKEEVQVNP